MKDDTMDTRKAIVRKNIRIARKRWPNLSRSSLSRLREIAAQHDLSVAAGDLAYISGGWYVTHTGLIGLARRKRCSGIQVEAVDSLCNSSANRFVVKATAYPFKTSVGFVGYGDADPSNVSDVVRGAEMRVAETRAVNRALRKAYGIGICSVEEIDSFEQHSDDGSDSKKLPPQPAKGNGTNRTVRDRLCQLIRQHQLDPNLVKAYAADFCGVKVVREATREQVENFVAHLAEWADKDRNALLCQLNSYLSQKEGVA
jgi:hypothetical protein